MQAQHIYNETHFFEFYCYFDYDILFVSNKHHSISKVFGSREPYATGRVYYLNFEIKFALLSKILNVELIHMFTLFLALFRTS